MVILIFLSQCLAFFLWPFKKDFLLITGFVISLMRVF